MCLEGVYESSYLAECERTEYKVEIEELKGQTAAMREALEDIISHPADEQKAMSVVVGMLETARRALQDTTAGRDLLERLAKAEEQVRAYRTTTKEYEAMLTKAESERVEAVGYDSLYEAVCQDSYRCSAGHYYDPIYVVKSVWEYLKDNNMIREAE